MKQQRADKLKKLKMPGKPMGAKDAEMDLEMMLADAAPEAMPDEEEEEEDADMIESDEMGESESMLADISDDELMQEMEMRGLSMDDMKKAPEPEELEEEEEEDDMGELEEYA